MNQEGFFSFFSQVVEKTPYKNDFFIHIFSILTTKSLYSLLITLHILNIQLIKQKRYVSLIFIEITNSQIIIPKSSIASSNKPSVHPLNRNMMRPYPFLPRILMIGTSSYYPKSVIRVYGRLAFVMFHDVTWSRHRKRAFSAHVFRNGSS